MTAKKRAGDFSVNRGAMIRIARHTRPTIRESVLNVWMPAKEGFQLFHGFNGGHSFRIGYAEKVLELSDDDGYGNTGGKAGCDGKWDVLNQPAEPAESHDD